MPWYVVRSGRRRHRARGSSCTHQSPPTGKGPIVVPDLQMADHGEFRTLMPTNMRHRPASLRLSLSRLGCVSSNRRVQPSPINRKHPPSGNRPSITPRADTPDHGTVSRARLFPLCPDHHLIAGMQSPLPHMCVETVQSGSWSAPLLAGRTAFWFYPDDVSEGGFILHHGESCSRAC
ncbi:hypothetical protein K505DRAFT_101679 [Melanomma pulvis-pyrius CBS 109.77]|uniref:Uncharacterized protein n=1 Tax=Melanomma pulvis-pyrius CBS 109.77 TaxID=1314802 RepID=A0A6A6WY26_9PLEO|nr:hypothetical protein K505DRAFT_101679 [Melanomma pulvis-pyrius CBS 109.77]